MRKAFRSIKYPISIWMIMLVAAVAIIESTAALAMLMLAMFFLLVKYIDDSLEDLKKEVQQKEVNDE